MAVNQVLERYPDVSFNVLALHPDKGSAAQAAIEETRVKRHAKKVVRSLTDVGVSNNKVSVSYDKNADIEVGEVHVYIF